MKNEEKNSRIMKISAVILTLALLIGIASSCSKNKQQEEEITRGSNTIEAPVNKGDNNIFGEEFPDDTTVTTSGQTTTAASTTKKPVKTTAAAKVPVTVANPQANAQINQAVNNGNSGGLDAASLAEFVNVMGYDYDPVQGIFYTSQDNWQRQGNFVEHYDTAASYFNMNYRTVRIDFGQTDGMDWRIQLWKGLYGPFGGCEIGVYNTRLKTKSFTIARTTIIFCIWNRRSTSTRRITRPARFSLRGNGRLTGGLRALS